MWCVLCVMCDVCVFRSIFIGVSMIFSTTPRANLLWRLMATYWILGLVEVVGDLRVLSTVSSADFPLFFGWQCSNSWWMSAAFATKTVANTVWIRDLDWFLPLAEDNTTKHWTSCGWVVTLAANHVFFTALCGFELWNDEPFLILI